MCNPEDEFTKTGEVGGSVVLVSVLDIVLTYVGQCWIHIIFRLCSSGGVVDQKLWP